MADYFSYRARTMQNDLETRKMELKKLMETMPDFETISMINERYSLLDKLKDKHATFVDSKNINIVKVIRLSEAGSAHSLALDALRQDNRNQFSGLLWHKYGAGGFLFSIDEVAEIYLRNDETRLLVEIKYAWIDGNVKNISVNNGMEKGKVTVYDITGVKTFGNMLSAIMECRRC